MAQKGSQSSIFAIFAMALPIVVLIFDALKHMYQLLCRVKRGNETNDWQ